MNNNIPSKIGLNDEKKYQEGNTIKTGFDDSKAKFAQRLNKNEFLKRAGLAIFQKKICWS